MSKRKFAKLGAERIPMVRDVATWVYLEDAGSPGWPESSGDLRPGGPRMARGRQCCGT
ncbi:MAG: hypothetical protein HC933_03855 [Pleurocapsa sp. SU_196_0]|nr:hypothetical protein [Pleurocapsa sp. SU_196_0]